MGAQTWTRRREGTGVPEMRWKVTRHADYVAHYEGHAFITADPKGIGRSVCDGFIDDMDWIVKLHNGVIGNSWRARLARRLLNVHEVADESHHTAEGGQ